MIIKHDSKLLQEKFKKKPYQGVSPEKATFLFVGLDANYEDKIEKHPIYNKILEYHENGVKFWQTYKIHHPFLLPSYKGSGKLYHKNFSTIGFKPEHAELVSFVELVNIPTVGRSKLSVDDLNADHLRKLNDWIIQGKAKYVFLSSKVILLMKQSDQFKWLPIKSKYPTNSLGILKEFPGKTVYKHLHFSNYGRFKEQMKSEALEINALLAYT